MSGIILKNISKTYPKTGAVALNSVDLNVQPGSMVALLGPNGAGKSTLIKIICGLVTPDSGQVMIEGFDLLRKRRKALTCLSVSLEGDRNLYQRLTALENIQYFLALGNTPIDMPRLKNLAERFQLTAHLNSQTRFLSKGTKQKVSIMIALLSKASIVVLDEPTVGVDVQVKHELCSILREIPAEGRSVLLSTHEMDVAQEVADRVVIFREGQAIANASPIAIRELYSKCEYSLLVSTFPESVEHSDFSVSEENGNQRVVVVGGVERALCLAQKLVTLGVTVYACERHFPSLENVYISIMEKS